jgi:patatin-like phospholipase/acyl hydrolase
MGERMSSFRILSIDAGGVRGVYTAVLLQRIAAQVPELFEETDFFVGSSTGAITSVGLASGLPAAEIVEIFRAYGQVVLGQSIVQNLGQLVGAKYDILNLKRLLTPYFGAGMMLDLIKRRGKLALVPAFDLDGRVGNVRTWKPKIFHNFPGGDADDGELIVDVVVRSNATPVFFASYQGYIDGTVVAVNPSMLAVAQALDPRSGSLDLNDLRVLSLSSGYFPRYIGGQEHDWGLPRWSWPLVSLMSDGQMGVADFEVSRLLGPQRYFRLAPLLPEAVALDDGTRIPDLISYAEAVNINDTVAWIKRFFLA